MFKQLAFFVFTLLNEVYNSVGIHKFSELYIPYTVPAHPHRLRKKLSAPFPPPNPRVLATVL